MYAAASYTGAQYPAYLAKQHGTEKYKPSGPRLVRRLTNLGLSA
jgi:hypothetical protein